MNDTREGRKEGRKDWTKELARLGTTLLQTRLGLFTSRGKEGMKEGRKGRKNEGNVWQQQQQQQMATAKPTQRQNKHQSGRMDGNRGVYGHKYREPGFSPSSL